MLRFRKHSVDSGGALAEPAYHLLDSIIKVALAGGSALLHPSTGLGQELMQNDGVIDRHERILLERRLRREDQGRLESDKKGLRE